MTILTCGCDVDHNAITLCSKHFEDFKMSGALRLDYFEIKEKFLYFKKVFSHSKRAEKEEWTPQVIEQDSLKEIK